ncbi:MAG: S-ribosylhomocysteine lyase [bacterium]
METTVESFALDHRQVKAPYVRKAARLQGEKGDIVTKFDLRFLQPNVAAMPGDAMHTLEHLLAVLMREELPGIIDLSPMGCRTGFYLIVWGDREAQEVQAALLNSLARVLEAREIPAANEIQCGHYREHSLNGAHEYARKVLEGFGQ